MPSRKHQHSAEVAGSRPVADTEARASAGRPPRCGVHAPRARRGRGRRRPRRRADRRRGRPRRRVARGRRQRARAAPRPDRARRGARPARRGRAARRLAHPGLRPLRDPRAVRDVRRARSSSPASRGSSTPRPTRRPARPAASSTSSASPASTTAPRSTAACWRRSRAACSRSSSRGVGSRPPRRTSRSSGYASECGTGVTKRTTFEFSNSQTLKKSRSILTPLPRPVPACRKTSTTALDDLRIEVIVGHVAPGREALRELRDGLHVGLGHAAERVGSNPRGSLHRPRDFQSRTLSHSVTSPGGTKLRVKGVDLAAYVRDQSSKAKLGTRQKRVLQHNRVKSRHRYYSVCDWPLLAQSGR